MAKSRKQKTPKSGFDCEEVEKYLDKAIDQVRKEIIPRIDTLDNRDKEQYDAAKKIMSDANTVIIARTEQVERTVKSMDNDLHEVLEARRAMTTQLVSSLKKIEDKLDAHIAEETQEFASIREGLTKAATHVETIQQTLDNVSANGNKGLSASLTDMYNKLHELQDVTQGARARAKFWMVMHDVVVTTPFLKPLKHKWGVIIYAAILLLVLNTFFHALGIEWDLLGIFKWLVTFGKGN